MFDAGQIKSSGQKSGYFMWFLASLEIYLILINPCSKTDSSVSQLTNQQVD